MPSIQEKLQQLAQELAQLQEAAEAPSDRFDEGYAAGRRDHHAAVVEVVRSALNSVAPSNAPTVAPTPHFTPKPQVSPDTPRLSAPTKDNLVRQYLAAHPGARYRDMNRDLAPYVATRVYALEKRGEAYKDEEGRFYLTQPGASDVARQRERDELP